jgi:hypothetical protein
VTHVHWWGSYSVAKLGDPQLSIQQVDWEGNPVSRALDCTGSQRVTCGADGITGDTTGGPSNVNFYGCSDWLENGPEVVYQVKIPFPETYATFIIDSGAVDLDLFLLTDCHESTCIEYSSMILAHTFAEPGTYYLVVDGFYGAYGPFALTIDCPSVQDELFCIRFYEDSPAGSRAGPGAMLYEQWTDDFHEVPEGAPLNYSYWADIPPFTINAGQRYWASIQCVSERLVTGQWFWTEALPVEFLSPFMDFPLLNVPRWTYFPDPPINNETDDLAFELFAQETAVEQTSWGTIKAMYR